MSVSVKAQTQIHNRARNPSIDRNKITGETVRPRGTLPGIEDSCSCQSETAVETVRTGDTLSGFVEKISGANAAQSGKKAEELADKAGLPVFTLKEWAMKHNTKAETIAAELAAQGFKGNANEIRFVELNPGEVVTFEKCNGRLVAMNKFANADEYANSDVATRKALEIAQSSAPLNLNGSASNIHTENACWPKPAASEDNSVDCSNTISLKSVASALTISAKLAVGVPLSVNEIAHLLTNLSFATCAW